MSAILIGFNSTASFAQAATPKIDSGDTAWMLTATALVLLMTIPGLALFYGGMVRKTNVLSVLMQCFAICCLMSILWMIIGYSLAFDAGNAYVGGLGKLFLKGLTVDAVNGTIPDSLFMVFQMTFAIITPALIVGAFADRMKFSAMLLFTGIWLLVVYAPVTHWVWGGGFLGSDGILDFAGGTGVHINAGIAGLVAAIMIGKRKALGTETVLPHNLVLSVIGASFLWVGWFGFNGGSQLALGSGADATAVADIFVNTNLAAAGGVLACMIVSKATNSHTNIAATLNGAIAGLVAITAEPLTHSMGQAVIIGAIGGIICMYGMKLLDMLKIDDVVGAIPAHLFAGIWGTLVVAWTNPDAALGVQAIGVVSYGLFTVILSFIVWFVIKTVIGIRASKEDEEYGLDMSELGTVSYPDFNKSK